METETEQDEREGTLREIGKLYSFTKRTINT